MTEFQAAVIAQLRTVASKAGLPLTFEPTGAHECARFPWHGREVVILVGEGELIFEFDGEHYFESSIDSAHPRVRAFVELVQQKLMAV